MNPDPVDTANVRWREFLQAYNRFCMDRDGLPFLNQTFSLTGAFAQKALGSRLDRLVAAQRQYEPSARLVNDYFRQILTGA